MIFAADVRSLIAVLTQLLDDEDRALQSFDFVAIDQFTKRKLLILEKLEDAADRENPRRR